MDDLELKDQIERALNQTYFFLKFRPRTEKEVVDYLAKKIKKFHWNSSIIPQVIERLKNQNFINDQKFIEWFVDQRNRTRPKSAFVLKAELFRFGVPKNFIDEYFEEPKTDEEHLVLEALKSKWYRFEKLDKRERFQKSAAFLSRRGFSFDLIKGAIKKLEDGE